MAAPFETGLAVIPARDEADNLPEILRDLKRLCPGLPILVVDDGSSDGTARVARAEGARVVRHPFWIGYGAALQTGFKFAIQTGADWVVTVDGDGQHDPVSLPDLVRVVAGGAADIAVGSRFLVEPAYPLGFLKLAGVRFFRLVFRCLGGQPVTDPTSGFRCFSRAAYRFCARDLFPHDYPDTDLLLTLLKARFRILEVPAAMRPRTRGRSMHAGFPRQVYYAFKMTVSILATVFRESHGYLGDAKGAWKP